MFETDMETPFYGIPRLTAELKCHTYREIINGGVVLKSLNLWTVYLYLYFNILEQHLEMRNSRIIYANASQLQCSSLQRSEYNGRISLRRNVMNGCGLLRKTGDFQFGSRETI